MNSPRSGTGSSGAVPPGLHGMGIGSGPVNPGGKVLTPGGAVEPARRVEDLTFDVQVMNQGENDEKQVQRAAVDHGVGNPVNRTPRP